MGAKPPARGSTPARRPNYNDYRYIACHLATAHQGDAKDAGTVLSDRPPSLQTLVLYGQRFGGIEPHFKDYKSAAFEVLHSGLHNAQALTCLLMLLDCATLIAVMLGMLLQAGNILPLIGMESAV